MNNDPAAQHARMPPCNNTTAPKWDESHPRELLQYFKELEYLFTDCGIADNTQKKEYASQYISYNTAETWLGLPEFGDNISNNAPQPYTYQEWKLAVLRLYPSTDASTHYNLGNLEQLVNQTFNTPAAKPADKGKASECTIANEQLPVAKEPIAQPPIHLFSGIPGHYVPPTKRNFTAPNRTSNAYLYAMASNISDLSLPPHSYLVSADTSNPLILGQTLPLDTHVTDTTPSYINIPFPAQFVTNKPSKQRGVQVKKKYKPVAMKTKPVASHVSKDFQIKHQIIGNPLVTIP
ncbi:hypothetical protein E4T56_gene2754 [Termitomyces sp. T112]|nr:hypothetical protein E4T56_gene2754 [Termitomyces sp. T112]